MSQPRRDTDAVLTETTRRAILARLAVLSATGYVAPKAIAISPAAAANPNCPSSPFGNGKAKGRCK